MVCIWVSGEVSLVGSGPSVPVDMSSVLALDIGGTKVVAAVVSADGSVRGRRVIATVPGDGADRVIERAIDLAADVREEHGAGEPLVSLGVSSKGLTREDGVLMSGMAGWSGLHIPARLRERFPDMAVSVMNDVKAATLAEMTWGRSGGSRTGSTSTSGRASRPGSWPAARSSKVLTVLPERSVTSSLGLRRSDGQRPGRPAGT